MDPNRLTEGLKGANFRSFPFRDKNPLGGGTKDRLLYNPNEPMRKIHARLVKALRDLGFPLPFATGALPGCSVRQNVLRHRRNRFFYLLDLKSAYQSVSPLMLSWALTNIDKSLSGREAELLEFLEQFCVREGGLATGAPASPDLFNLYCGWYVDGRVAELCERYRLTYTRYLDDLTFSSLYPIWEKKRRAIRSVVLEAGFRVSHEKGVVGDLRRGPIKLNGLLLEWRGQGKPARLLVPRPYLRRINGLIHVALRSETGEHERARIVHLVNGMMSVFWEGADPHGLNHFEKKLLDHYRELQAQVVWYD